MKLKEQLMYKCEACEGVKLFGMDFGNVFMTMCESCKLMRFFHRIYVARSSALYHESLFFVEDQGKEEDGEKGTIN